MTDTFHPLDLLTGITGPVVPTPASTPADRLVGITPAEADGLRRLTDALAAELDGYGWDRADLEWIAEATLHQAAHLIRNGEPLTLPNLGRFRRVQPPGDPQAPRIDWTPDPMLLETAL